MQLLIGVLCGLAVVLAVGIRLFFRLSPRIGGRPSGARAERIKALPNHRDGKLHNLVPTDMRMPLPVLLKVMWWMLRGGEGREPKQALPVAPFDRAAWERIPASEVALAWFGHSTLLIKMGGLTFLTDPVFGARASMFTFVGPERFTYTERPDVARLPHIDVLLLSHDHYDHLCYDTVRQLVAADKVGRCIAALGVGAHLERWGMAPSLITELAWWEQVDLGKVKLTCVPTRHFTGRTMLDRFHTLWGSFVLEEEGRRIYFGADSGYSPTFKEVGERFGPFDLALLECGAYSRYWPLIHMMPEETAQAALDLRARVLMPIHWAGFALGLHLWKEPIERLERIAAERGIPLLTPRIGHIVTSLEAASSARWWVGVE